MSNDLLTLADLTSDYAGRRELKKLVLPETFGPKLAGKAVYYYSVVTIAESRVARQYVRHDTNTGVTYIDQEGIVEGLMARLRDERGDTLFKKHVKRELMQQIDASLLSWLWNEIGGIGADTTVEAVEEAKKD